MKFPVNIPIGNAEIPAHLVFEILAYSIGFRYFLKLRKNAEDKISTEHRMLLFIAAAFGAFVFSRLIGVMEYPEFYSGNITFAMFFSSKTILGGLFGGLIAVEICKKIIGVKYSSGDLMTYPLILAMIIGRIGCFLSGLEDGTYGTKTSLIFGIDLGDGVYRHPTSLYEIVFLIFLWIVLFLVESKYLLADGTKFKFFLFSYFIFRLFVEFIKPRYIILSNLSVLQITSIVGIFYYYKMFFKPDLLILKRKNA